jgi:hypothetical protein
MLELVLLDRRSGHLTAFSSGPALDALLKTFDGRFDVEKLVGCGIGRNAMGCAQAG